MIHFFYAEDEIIDISAIQLEKIAEAFRGNRVFCLVFLLCVYPFTTTRYHNHPTAEERNKGSVLLINDESLHNENTL